VTRLRREIRLWLASRLLSWVMDLVARDLSRASLDAFCTIAEEMRLL
jgi:hypothetical protein